MAYAIAFDLNTESLKKTYEGAYNNAYAEIKNFLTDKGFTRQQGSVYFGNEKVDAVSAVTTIQQLSIQKPWFYPSITDIRLLRIEDNNDLMSAIKLVQK